MDVARLVHKTIVRTAVLVHKLRKGEPVDVTLDQLALVCVCVFMCEQHKYEVNGVSLASCS
jgi:hypothetical protein